MRVVFLSAEVVFILTGVGSHRATSVGELFQHPATLVTSGGRNCHASE